MKILLKNNKEEIGKEIASRIVELINKKPNTVLGLATGSSPITTYKELIKAYKEKKVSFKYVTTFNLDEYVGYKREKDSYKYFMHHNLFDEIDIKDVNTHFPDATNPLAYDKEIELKEIDFQVLGIGADGHIGFNEPMTSFDSKTHITKLTKQTISDNSQYFESIDAVPKEAVTMGLSTIMKAKEIVLIATGKNKRSAIKALLAGESKGCPASILNRHPNVTIYLDKDADPREN